MNDDLLLEELWLDILIGRKARLRRLVRLAMLEERTRLRMVQAHSAHARCWNIRHKRWTKLMTSRMEMELQLAGDMV